MKEKHQEDRLLHLIQAIQKVARFSHPVESFELLETHISYILLTGPYAYKFKKPVNLGFLDFTTLTSRKHYCEEEVRLNKRLAPEIYNEVVAITGTAEKPVIGGADQVIEYAVKMVQFPGGSELDQVLKAGLVNVEDIDKLARQVAAFHETVDVATEDSMLGSTTSIQKTVLDNFSHIRPIIDDADHLEKLDQLEMWTKQRLWKLGPVFETRKKNGYIRECHGDLHTGNIALLDHKPVIFDCIEFSEELRWIDIINEIAFTVMDLDARGHPAFAQRFLNLYLQITGDYGGLQLLRFYQVYRALVRCKVACISYQQANPDHATVLHITEDYHHYLDLAYQYIQPVSTCLLVTHGLTASGKTTCTQELLQSLGAIRIRSDIERKRKHGLQEYEKSGSGIASGIYTDQSSSQTYEQLATLTEIVLDAGYPVIVDATFLHLDQRMIFRNIAYARNLPFVILDFQTDEKQLRERIIKRQLDAVDASEATLEVLNYQLETQEPLGADETRLMVKIDTSVETNIKELTEQVKQKISAI